MVAFAHKSHALSQGATVCLCSLSFVNKAFSMLTYISKIILTYLISANLIKLSSISLLGWNPNEN